MGEHYGEPVSALLTYGDAAVTHAWRDYPATFGFRPEHVPELIRMATDPALIDADAESSDPWAPVHARRSLAQLGATEAAGPLVALLDNPDDEWASIDMPTVMKLIGMTAIPALGQFLSEANHREYPRMRAVECLSVMAESHPESREECIGILKDQMAEYRANGASLNALLIEALCDFGARGATPVMERAIQEQQVNTDLVEVHRVRLLADDHD